MRLLDRLTTLRSDYSQQRITLVLLIAWLLASCSPLGAVPSGGATPTPAPPTQLPTETHTPAPTATAIPSPTPEPWTLAPYPEELTEAELTVQIATDGAAQALDAAGQVAATWDGAAWVRVLPLLPDWAEGYAKYHQGVPEQIGDKWYYTVDRTVEVNGETRAVQVKLLELTEKGEWLPCYETIEELLTDKQLMTLMKLNQITAPEEALWLVRTGETIETEREDLVKLEQIIARFMEANDHLFGEHGWGGVSASRGVSTEVKMCYLDVGRLYHLPKTQDFVIDGVDISCPHAYFVVRRGTEDQVVLGGIPLRFQHTSVFLGFDKSVIDQAYDELGEFAPSYTTDFGQAISYYQNLPNEEDVYAPIFWSRTETVPGDVLKYFSLKGVDSFYVLNLIDASKGNFMNLKPFFSGGMIYWLRAIPLE